MMQEEIIQRKWIDDYNDNIIMLWIRKLITSLFYYRVYRKLYPNNPWYAPRAIRFFKKKIGTINKVFEFGSGHSSIWIAKQVNEYTAVEHDKSWYNSIVNRLQEEKISNVKIIFIPPNENSNEFDWKKEWQYFKVINRPPKDPQFRQYMSAIDQFPDKHFDCIIIDGKERIGCLLHGLPKLSENGILIFDDSDILRFADLYSIMSHWHYISFKFGLQHTTFFARHPEVLKG